MTDSTLNQYISRGTNAERVAFTPSPPTPGSGNHPSYVFYETDTTNTYMWDGSAWQKVNNSSGSVTTTGSPASGNLTKFSGAATVTSGDLSGDVTTSGTLATTIANNAVTTAKINNSAVTLAKIANAAASSKLLGSGAAGAGSAYAELTLGTGLSMSGTTLNASGGWTEALWNDFASANAQSVECDVTGAKEILIIGNDLVNSSSVQRIVQVSVDGGTNWFTTSGNYDEISAVGVSATNGAFFPHTTAATAARSIAVRISNNGFGRTIGAFLLPRSIQARFLGSTTAINRVRVTGSSGGTGSPAGTMTSGTVEVLIR